jgi:cysteine synthase
MKIYESVLDIIGGTPLVRLKGNRNILAKLESQNPGGSVKDRLGYALILDGEKKGRLKPGSHIIEPTSGNTGIGLAMVAATRGYRCTLVMPDSVSIERIKLLHYLGADTLLTPGEHGMKGAVEEAERLHGETPGSYMPRQFDNEVNARFHRETTAVEIWDQSDGSVDIFVAGVGTGGTITGVGTFLREQKKNVTVVAVEPASSPVLSGGMPGVHKLQGIGAGFVPHVYDSSVVDEVITIEDKTALSTARKIAASDGILCGISSGAALAAAYELASRYENREKNIVVLLPDSAERYASTELFEDDNDK